MFIQIKDDLPFGHPIADDNFRMLIPSNISVPRYPLTKDILSLGFAVYEFAQKPQFDPSEFKVAEEGTPVWENDDIRGDFITQVWNVRDMTEEEKSVVISQKWQEIRSIRDNKLLRSDWTQIPNSPISEEKKQEWFVYRQELRDITNQPDPFNVIWPIQP